MKKTLLLAAFVGLLSSSAVANTFGDDKNKKDSKKTESKACAGEKKEGCAKGEKSCCKSKKADASATTATDTKSTEKK